MATGGLTGAKAVTVDNAAVTEATKTLADGTYTFTITGPNGYSKTDSIKVTNGVAESSIVLENLKPGEYTITEGESTNGTTLTGRSGGTNEGDQIGRASGRERV